MSEVDEGEILAAKKRLNFCDDSKMMRRLSNPVSVYTRSSQAWKQGKRMRKQLYKAVVGESCTSSEATQSMPVTSKNGTTTLVEEEVV